MILFTIFPFAPPPPPLAFLCFKLFRSLYIWFSMPPVCHFPLFFIHFIMLYDFRPTGWKMTIILLQQPAINRAEEYMEWRAEWGLQCKMKTHACVHTHTHAWIYGEPQVNLHTYSPWTEMQENTCMYAASVLYTFPLCLFPSSLLSDTHTLAAHALTVKTKSWLVAWTTWETIPLKEQNK